MKMGPEGPGKMEIGPEGPEKLILGVFWGSFLVIFLVPRAGRQGQIRPNLFFFSAQISLFFSGLAGGLFFFKTFLFLSS